MTDLGYLWFPYFLNWYADHFIIGTFFLIFVYYFVRLPFQLIFKLYNRTLRRRNIHDHGWPPAHLDADGDHKEEEI